jgi:hypothetical protein
MSSPDMFGRPRDTGAINGVQETAFRLLHAILLATNRWGSYRL